MTTMPSLKGEVYGYTEEQLGAMSPAEFVGTLRSYISQPGRGMIDHPVVSAIENGTMMLPQMKLFVEQFYLHVRNMLPSIGEMYAKCPEEDARNVLVKNLAEECLGVFTKTKGHPDLLLDFGAAIGMDIPATKLRTQVPESKRLTNYFEFMANCRPWFVPVSAICLGLESVVPPTFTRIADGLRKHYGMKEDQIVFWTLHIVADVEHGDEGIDLVSRYALTPEARRLVFEGTVETSRLYYDLWNVWQGI